MEAPVTSVFSHSLPQIFGLFFPFTATAKDKFGSNLYLRARQIKQAARKVSKLASEPFYLSFLIVYT